MNRSKHFGTGLLLAATWAVAPCRADDPNLNALVAKIPLLSHESKDLESFYLRGQVQMRDGLFVNFEVAWAAPNQCVSLISIGDKDPAPVLYCAQNRILLVDYFKGVVSYHETGSPQFNVSVDADDKLSFQMGIKSTVAGKIVVDLAKLLQSLGDDAKWEQRPDKTGRYSRLSKSGMSRAFADFDAGHPYPLRKLEVRYVDGDTPLFVFEDMTINKPIPPRLRTFPGRDQFPDGIVVETMKFSDDRKLAAGAELMKQFMTGLLATAAIENRDLREAVEAFGKVDWEQAEKNRRKYAPQLRRMLENAKAAEDDDGEG
jgi:hypothetical protein